jgi:hypothetical protein
METGLGLVDTPDEPWRPRLLLWISLLGALGPAVLIVLWRVIWAGKGEKGASGCRFGGVLVRRAGLILLLALGGFSLWGLLDSRDRAGGRRSGVLRETAVRRVPDPAGTVIGVFREGQPVWARPLSASWVWVEIPDSPREAGWIPEEAIVFYTRR